MRAQLTHLPGQLHPQAMLLKGAMTVEVQLTPRLCSRWYPGLLPAHSPCRVLGDGWISIVKGPAMAARHKLLFFTNVSKLQALIDGHEQWRIGRFRSWIVYVQPIGF